MGATTTAAPPAASAKGCEAAAPRGAAQTAPRRAPTSRLVPPAAIWPCTACGEQNALADARCASCGAGFLAGLRHAEPPLLVLPVVGDLSVVPAARRRTLAVVAVVAFLVVVAVLGLLLP